MSKKKTGKIEILRGGTGGFYYRVKGGNGEILVHSEIYVSVNGVYKGIEALEGAMRAREIDDSELRKPVTHGAKELDAEVDAPNAWQGPGTDSFSTQPATFSGKNGCECTHPREAHQIAYRVPGTDFCEGDDINRCDCEEWRPLPDDFWED